MYKNALLILLHLLPLPLLAGPNSTDPKALEAELETAAGEERLTILVDLASHYRKTNPENTIATATEALELLKIYPNRSQEIEVLLCLSEAHIDRQDNDAGLSYAKQAEFLATPLDDPSIIARIRFQSGRAFLNQLQFKDAMELLIDARNFFESAEEMDGVGFALYCIAGIHQAQSEYKEMSAAYLESAEFFKKSENYSMVGHALGACATEPQTAVTPLA